MKINAITSFNNIIFGRKRPNYRKNNAVNNTIPNNNNSKPTLPEYQKRYSRMLEGMLADGKEMAELCEQYARELVIYKDDDSKIATITKEHCYLAFLDDILQYAKSIEQGEVDYTKDQTNTSNFATGMSTQWVWSRENAHNSVKIIQEEYDRVYEELKAKSSQDAFVSAVMIDEEFMKDIDDLASVAMTEMGNYDIKNVGGSSAFFMSAITFSKSSTGRSFTNKVKEFMHKLSIGAVTDDINKNSAIMPYYQDIASRIIKNADKNYNMYVTYSKNDESAPQYLVNNLIEQLKNINDKDFKNLKKDKIKTIVFNNRSDLNIIADECNKCKNDSDTQYFIIINDIKKIFNASVIQNDDGTRVISYVKLDDSLGTKAKNLHLILLSNGDDYYNVNSEPLIEKATRDYQNLQIPIMDENILKDQVLQTKDYIMSQIENNIEDDALTYIAGLPLNSKGSKYDNFIRFVKNLAFYYVDSETITKEMVQSYWENTQKSDLAEHDNPYDMVFNTNRNLESIKGTPMVKKQAENVVYEMTNFPKTKGYIIYNADGSSEGRMNCAKAIAGELKIPMICINASDFAMRDLDTISQDPMKAIEVKMSKLINMLKTQAQANSNKMVMLFISNFDNFASDPIYGLSSIYEQQAFQKLLKEMKKSSSNDNYNIIVMGSSNYPEITRDDIIRPELFMDDIVIYPPSTPQNFKEIALNHIEKNNYQFEDKEKTFAHFIKLMNGTYASYIDTVAFLDKANVLAHKRGVDKISIADINEAYLSRTTGEVSQFNISDRQKSTIIKHEGGHALNLQFMYNLFKEKGDDLRIGDSIINIALDPRGDYLGCVYHANSYENTVENNMETVMSDLVCSFGGNSSEEEFFNMAGSWGISQDMRSANNLAKIAVLMMGLGARTGHFMPDFDYDGNAHFDSAEDAENYAKDVKTLLGNAKIISDKIIRCYSGFLEEFSKNNIKRFATGDCIITGDDFASSLKEWEDKQSARKKVKIKRLKKLFYALLNAQNTVKFIKQ